VGREDRCRRTGRGSEARQPWQTLRQCRVPPGAVTLGSFMGFMGGISLRAVQVRRLLLRGLPGAVPTYKRHAVINELNAKARVRTTFYTNTLKRAVWVCLCKASILLTRSLPAHSPLHPCSLPLPDAVRPRLGRLGNGASAHRGRARQQPRRSGGPRCRWRALRRTRKRSCRRWPPPSRCAWRHSCSSCKRCMTRGASRRRGFNQTLETRRARRRGPTAGAPGVSRLTPPRLTPSAAARGSISGRRSLLPSNPLLLPHSLPRRQQRSQQRSQPLRGRWRPPLRAKS
jgi:hypothetical protein